MLLFSILVLSFVLHSSKKEGQFAFLKLKYSCGGVMTGGSVFIIIG